ncbi:MAG: AtpZ/AtpI family protein [Bacteroidetes bacterium]|nr:AtpZ/AtpI family protein [Bacteroidota bacterium]MBS1672301.1 AtpZ/AtpI family protein [Bacteroidota bacterium]
MKEKSNKELLIIYAGFATQLTVALLIAAYAGYWVDKKNILKFPLFIWLLPLLVIIGMIVKTIKDTSEKK